MRIRSENMRRRLGAKKWLEKYKEYLKKFFEKHKFSGFKKKKIYVPPSEKSSVIYSEIILRIGMSYEEFEKDFWFLLGMAEVFS